MKWFRKGKMRGPLSGFIITWDANSHDAAQCRRLQPFIYGFSLIRDGREYRYAGFIEQEGVRYIGQSVLMVRTDKMPPLVEGLRRVGVDFDLEQAWIA